MKAATRALIAALFLLSLTVGVVHCTEPITIAGTVTDDDELEKNTVDLNSALAGTDVEVCYFVF